MDDVALRRRPARTASWRACLIARAYLAIERRRGQRTRVLVPDCAHGTNPATAAMAGFDVKSIPSDADGNMDIDALEAALDETATASRR